LITIGIVAGPQRGNGAGRLGCECSGIVTKVGPEAKNVQVGDRVISIANGSFATTLTTSEKLCAKMSDDLSFVEGATIPCVYGTVIYSLLDLARLQKDQVSLCHSNVEKKLIDRLIDCAHPLRVWWGWNCCNSNCENDWS